jgi:hypothetical protein
MRYDSTDTINFLCSNVAEIGDPEFRPYSPIISFVCRGKEQAKEGHWRWTMMQFNGMECRKRTEVKISC